MKSRSEPVVVTPYDPAWPAAFERLRAGLAAALGDVAAGIEHVGSTAVPGLAAKPILDVDVVIRNDGDVFEAARRLATLGYTHLGDLGVAGREAFAAPAQSAVAHHLYVCAAGATELQRHLAFRDELRADAALAAEYGALKLELAQRYRDDRDAYSEGKTAFVLRVLRRRDDDRRLRRR